MQIIQQSSNSFVFNFLIQGISKVNAFIFKLFSNGLLRTNKVEYLGNLTYIYFLNDLMK